MNDSQGDEVPTFSHLNKVHKVDESTAKTTKWMNLLLSPQGGQVYYKVHKVDESTAKSTKWTNNQVYKVEEPRTRKWTGLSPNSTK